MRNPVFRLMSVVLLTSSNNSTPRTVADDARSYSAVTTALPGQEVKDPVMQLVSNLAMVPGGKFLIVSSEGVYHGSHFDPNGYFTMLRITQGKKLFVLGVPRGGRSEISKHAKTHWTLLEDPELDIYLFVAEAGTTL